jgi:hypothetical protein
MGRRAEVAHVSGHRECEAPDQTRPEPLIDELNLSNLTYASSLVNSRSTAHRDTTVTA